MRSGDVGWELVGAGKPEWPELKMEVNNMMMLVMVGITLAVIHLVVVVVNNMMIMVVTGHGGVFVGLY